jgi:hypothetical protein
MAQWEYTHERIERPLGSEGLCTTSLDFWGLIVQVGILHNKSILSRYCLVVTEIDQ